MRMYVDTEENNGVRTHGHTNNNKRNQLILIIIKYTNEPRSNN
jgi:hypothetical protein